MLGVKFLLSAKECLVRPARSFEAKPIILTETQQIDAQIAEFLLNMLFATYEHDIQLVRLSGSLEEDMNVGNR